MIALLAVGALTLLAPPVQAETTSRDIGRASFFAGVCSTLGWESSRERTMAFGEAWGRAHPEIAAADIAAEVDLGLEDGRGEVTALIETFRTDGDVAAFGQALKTRCDALARDFPAVLSRTAETDAAFEAALARIVEEESGR